MNYVIVDRGRKFCSLTITGRCVWVSEYPDASKWESAATARRAFKAVVREGHCIAPALVENYGLESQRTIDRADLLERDGGNC